MRTPLGEAKLVDDSASPSSARAVTNATTLTKTPKPAQGAGLVQVAAAKGTPGAGKLLRRSSSSTMMEISKIASNLSSVAEKENDVEVDE